VIGIDLGQIRFSKYEAGEATDDDDDDAPHEGKVKGCDVVNHQRLLLLAQRHRRRCRHPASFRQSLVNGIRTGIDGGGQTRADDLLVYYVPLAATNYPAHNKDGEPGARRRAPLTHPRAQHADGEKPQECPFGNAREAYRHLEDRSQPLDQEDRGDGHQTRADGYNLVRVRARSLISILLGKLTRPGNYLPGCKDSRRRWTTMDKLDFKGLQCFSFRSSRVSVNFKIVFNNDYLAPAGQ
jgi:hypothetical protein